MTLFLDTSVLLAACGSERGASHLLFDLAPSHSWNLRTSPYVLREVSHNLRKVGPAAPTRWQRLLPALTLVDDVITLDRPAVFPASKDRPVLFSALAWAEMLLTLDRADFSTALGPAFYALPICTPGEFLMRERSAGRLSP